MNNLIHEIHFTNANDLSLEIVSFGADEALAKSIFNLMTNAFMRDGFILMGNVNVPNYVEVVQRGGSSVCFVELKSRPAIDMANITHLFTILALHHQNPRAFATGMVQAEVIKGEQLWATSEYRAKETTPDGRTLTHALAGDRQQALKAYIQLVGVGNKKVRLCPDGTNKYMVFSEAGITTFEFVEVSK